MHINITRNSLVDIPRLENLQKFSLDTRYIPGCVAEVGVYKGGTAYLLCEENQNKRVLLFDTFEGMPESNSEFDNHKKGDFADTSIQHVSKLLTPFTNWSLYKGIFPDQNKEYAEDHIFSLVHLDCDIYDSVKNCLEFFYPRMHPKGIIVLDDCFEPNCPGAYKAAHDFIIGKPIRLVHTTQSQAIIKSL